MWRGCSWCAVGREKSTSTQVNSTQPQRSVTDFPSVFTSFSLDPFLLPFPSYQQQPLHPRVLLLASSSLFLVFFVLFLFVGYPQVTQQTGRRSPAVDPALAQPFQDFPLFCPSFPQSSAWIVLWTTSCTTRVIATSGTFRPPTTASGFIVANSQVWDLSILSTDSSAFSVLRSSDLADCHPPPYHSLRPILSVIDQAEHSMA